MGANVKFFEDKISEIELQAKQYAEKESNEKHKIMLVPFGLGMISNYLLRVALLNG
jgi:hypothetical protein